VTGTVSRYNLYIPRSIAIEYNIMDTASEFIKLYKNYICIEHTQLTCQYCETSEKNFVNLIMHYCSHHDEGVNFRHAMSKNPVDLNEKIGHIICIETREKDNIIQDVERSNWNMFHCRESRTEKLKGILDSSHVDQCSKDLVMRCKKLIKTIWQMKKDDKKEEQLPAGDAKRKHNKKGLKYVKEKRVQRQYYHSITGSRILEEDLNEDSEDNTDESWKTELSKKMISDHIDLCDTDKTFFNLWNEYIRDSTLFKTFENMEVILKEFAVKHRSQLRTSLRQNFLLHLLNLFHYQRINRDTILNTTKVLDEDLFDESQ